MVRGWGAIDLKVARAKRVQVAFSCWGVILIGFDKIIPEQVCS